MQKVMELSSIFGCKHDFILELCGCITWKSRNLRALTTAYSTEPTTITVVNFYIALKILTKRVKIFII